MSKEHKHPDRSIEPQYCTETRLSTTGQQVPEDMQGVLADSRSPKAQCTQGRKTAGTAIKSCSSVQGNIRSKGHKYHSTLQSYSSTGKKGFCWN